MNKEISSNKIPLKKMEELTEVKEELNIKNKNNIKEIIGIKQKLKSMFYY